MRLDLSSEERRILLRAARDAIRARLDHTGEPSNTRLTPSLQARCGAFVTLYKGGSLRGCVGYTETDKSLYETVISAAKAAAFHDSRFNPVTFDELGSIDIEISVLGPATPIDNWENIEIGKHGIILEKGRFRALFLPQVALENGWDLPATLSHLARKAGVPEDGWRAGASFMVFTSIKFGEVDAS
ncbi:COG2078: Uncharacterized ACR [hydrothermal vent metagenome]|uniref:COG2078: Uncharacterized ACR n=1 Tax=hydrothermal vent metagenome TaxID=652676 RepID=A0A3B1CMP2_9ZZZZ